MEDRLPEPGSSGNQGQFKNLFTCNNSRNWYIGWAQTDMCVTFKLKCYKLSVSS